MDAEFDNAIHQEIAAEEAEESLSLSDLPLSPNETENKHLINSKNHHPSSNEPGELFEFFNNLGSEMSHAEDIFFCGKLVPFKDQSLKTDQLHKLSCKDDDKFKDFHTRRCGSLSELKMDIDRSKSTNTMLARNCRSLDYRKMRISSSLSYESTRIRRALSDKSSEKSDASVLIKVSKPRWYILMFGLGVVRFPQEMDLQDIKNRQIRRKHVAMSTSFKKRQKCSVNQNEQKRSCGLLRVFSCKDYTSVPVTASISYVPQESQVSMGL